MLDKVGGVSGECFHDPQYGTRLQDKPFFNFCD